MDKRNKTQKTLINNLRDLREYINYCLDKAMDDPDYFFDQDRGFWDEEEVEGLDGYIDDLDTSIYVLLHKEESILFRKFGRIS